MGFLWSQLRQAVPLIYHGDTYIWNVVWVTLRVALISTAAATVIGLPFAVTLGLGRFRGRRVLQALANASLALPSVVVGVFVLILLLPGGVLGSLRIEFTLRGVYIAGREIKIADRPYDPRQVTDFSLSNWTDLYTQARVAELRGEHRRLEAAE